MSPIFALLPYGSIIVPLLAAAVVIYLVFHVLPLDDFWRKILAIIIALALVIWLFASCATNTGDPVKDAHARATNLALTDAAKVLGQVGVSILLNVAQQELGGQKMDYGSAAAQGLYQNIDVIGTAQEARNIALTWSGGNAPRTAAAVQQVFSSVAADERSPVIVNAMAEVISTAVGAPPKK